MGEGFTFHPLEVSFSGYSGSGKSTLISKLIPLLGLDLAYIKHDVHKFSMDHPGKDTYVVKKAGAVQVFISNDQEQALLKTGGLNLKLASLEFLECDGVIAEGHKTSDLGKILVLDKEGALLKDPAFQNQIPLAVVGPDPESPALPWKVPYFSRDDAPAVATFLKNHWERILDQRPLYGLVLTGGRSQRMGQDKASLDYHGQSQVRRAVDLLKPFCTQVFVSCREDQAQDPDRRDFPQIRDRFLDFGPLSGILSAQFQEPGAAWLVTAVDLPSLDHSTLEFLIKHRNPFKFATAFRGFEDLPEPLCTVYEPKSRQRLLQFLAQGYRCPRKMLINSPVQVLDPPDPRTLQNINSPDERERILNDIRR